MMTKEVCKIKLLNILLTKSHEGTCDDKETKRVVARAE
jgi:hypothetical protein